MEILLIFVALFGVLLVVGIVAVAVQGGDIRTFLKRLFQDGDSTPDSEDVLAYSRRHEGLLTSAELEFLHVLEGVLAHPTDPAGKPQARVAVQVPFSMLVTTRKGLTRSQHQTAHNKIDRKRIDFVVTDHEMRPLVAIELDDSSHRQPKRRERDEFVDKVCEVAGVPLRHFPVTRHYDPQALTAELRNAMSIN